MKNTKEYDYSAEIIRYEDGDMKSIDDIATLFQYLVDNNILGELPGFYRSTARAMIKARMINA